MTSSSSKIPIAGAMVAGKYRIERVIGQGGMGVVVAAMHDELDQRVAIKFLSSETAKGTEWITRFAREARTAAKIKNEHAVKVFDVGKLESGVPFMVMEFLEGRNLDEILEERKSLPFEEAAEYVLQACEALAEAHLVGIVHRDLKPANLFVTHRTDGTMCVKILDFGISKIEENLASGVSITHTTSLVGSPLYMSPERLRGAKDVDRRADIWSLGVLLQEMVTGSTPFVAETIPDIHALVLTSAPIPLRRYCPSAPPALEAIVFKCLEKTVEGRYQNVLEFAKALAEIAPASRGSVDRISHITVGGSGPRSRVSLAPGQSGSLPPVDPRLVVTAAVDELRDSGRASSPSHVPPSTGSLPVVSKTGRLTQALKTPRVMVVGGAGVVAVVAIVAFFSMRRHAHVPAATLTNAAMTTQHAEPVLTAHGTTITNAVIADESATADTAPESTGTTAVDPKRAHEPRELVRGRKHGREAGATPSASVSVAPVATAPPPTPSQEVIDYGGRN
jgi:serine/threonine-protein kinase